MLNIIEVLKNRRLYPTYTLTGVAGDNKSSILRFVFFEDLNGLNVDEDLDKKLQILVGDEKLEFELTKTSGNYDFEISKEIIKSDEFYIQIELSKNGNIVWKSIPLVLNQKNSLGGSAKNKFNEIIKLIGDLKRLETTDKSSVVNAINEISLQIKEFEALTGTGETLDYLRQQIEYLWNMLYSQVDRLTHLETKKAEVSDLADDFRLPANKTDFIIPFYVPEGENLITGYEAGWVNVSNGNIVDSTDYATTDLIAVEQNAKYTIGCSAGLYGVNNFRIPCYDANGTFMKHNSLAPESLDIGPTGRYYIATVTIPEGDTAFIRTSIDVDYKDEITCLKNTECYKLGNVQLSDKDNTSLRTALNPLYGKTIVWNGDSICAGGKLFGDNENAWAGRIASRNEMTYKNYAISGATITTGFTDSKGTPKHWISDTIDEMSKEYPEADYIIVEGGTNDADIIWNKVKEAMGTNPTLDDVLSSGWTGSFEITDYTGNYNPETFCGALETIFYNLTTLWKGKKIGYIIPHKMGIQANYTASANTRRAFFELAIKIANKWGVPVLNLWDGCPLNPKLKSYYDSEKSYDENYYADGQHLTARGYDYEVPFVEAWLKSLVSNYSCVSQSSDGNNNINLDKTLSKDGMAADAKAVGDRLSAIEEMLSGVEALIDKSGVIQYDAN